MSTEHQKYSTLNQRDAITRYAGDRGIEVVRTYADEGKSGLNLKGRPGLAQLIQDVVNGLADFQLILVYDISRWGRFQDVDESAHYEFLCRQAGISVHYCAEQFENDGGLSSNLLKSIKRVMAGEFSRELSVKVAAGQRRLSAMGFRQGGSAGFGLRRWLVDENGCLKGELKLYEHKSIQTDRVILRPGPPEEITQINRIFRLFANDRRTERQIARILNADGILTDLGRPWTFWSIRAILRGEKYIGENVFGRVSIPLKGRLVRQSPETWVRIQGAFEPIVPLALFRKAQAIHQFRSDCLRDEFILDRLRRLLAAEGYLTTRLIERTKYMPSGSTYTKRFGSIDEAYRRVGYVQPSNFRGAQAKLRTRKGYQAAVDAVTDTLRSCCSFRADKRLDHITLNKTTTLAIIVAKSTTTSNGNLRWRFILPTEDRRDLTLVIRVHAENIFDYLFLPREPLIGRRRFVTTESQGFFGGYRGRVDLGDFRLATLAALADRIHAMPDWAG